ncbi:hypothetical protein CENSYa_1265 [Cenarchaeum symbiosum A]|uniref:Transcriptional regulator n=1 Tax=Cenarchaeum symbiosum (strain A) TaxID=414004 RepID=A0RX21_CENSY|nr:hypothetical protein CENSYa_1265 [Cenarchaeum symbiosum A]
MARPNILRLSEYDMTQRIIELLSNVCTRAVLFSVRDRAKDASQISDELNISLSTVYKTASMLEGMALLDVEKYVITPEGKKIKLYRSRIGKVEITMEDMDPVLRLYPARSAE